MNKEELIKYRKTRLLEIVIEEYNRPKEEFIKKLPMMSIEELENETDNIIVGSEILEELKKRKVKKKSIK